MKKLVKKKTKKVQKKAKKAKASAKVLVKKEDNGKEVGVVSTFFSHVSVAAIKLSAPLNVGDKIHFKGHTTDFKQTVSSMQIEGENLSKAKKGDHVGIKITDKVRPNDKVFLVK